MISSAALPRLPSVVSHHRDAIVYCRGGVFDVRRHAPYPRVTFRRHSQRTRDQFTATGRARKPECLPTPYQRFRRKNVDEGLCTVIFWKFGYSQTLGDQNSLSHQYTPPRNLRRNRSQRNRPTNELTVDSCRARPIPNPSKLNPVDPKKNFFVINWNEKEQCPQSLLNNNKK